MLVSDVFKGKFLESWSLLSTIRKPIIAAVSGYAVSPDVLVPFLSIPRIPPNISSDMHVPRIISRSIRGAGVVLQVQYELVRARLGEVGGRQLADCSAS